MSRFMLFLLVWCCAFISKGQSLDSVMIERDSLLRELQEMRSKEMALLNALDKSERDAREDSLRKVEEKLRIDSLRKFTLGIPLVIDGDTLLYIYASLGGDDAVHRVASASRRILQVGKSITLSTDSMHIFEGEYTTDIMCGEMVLLRVSDLDGLWNGLSRQQLAEHHMEILTREIALLHEKFGLKAKLTEIGWASLLVVVQIFLLFLTVRFVRYLRRCILEKFKGRFKTLAFREYTILHFHQVQHFLLAMTRILQVLLIIVQLFISLPLLFSIFPETEEFTWHVVRYVETPLRDIIVSLVHIFPNLVKIMVVIYLVWLLLRGLRYITEEIAIGRLKIDKFYQDWAYPTYHIIRIFIIAFTLVVIWPWLPGSESGIFKGVSIFVAALFSLGSTTIIGNLISGLIITYMRPFLVGDYVCIGDCEGVVIERNAFTTRLKDIKGNLITVPNNSILSQQTVNYTAAMRQGQGTIVHSEFTFTYKVPRQTIESYLLEGANRCPLLLKTPKPFVLVTALDDFYTRYEINAYTQETEILYEVYSDLHKHIIDVFHEQDLDPTSSHFVKVAHV